MVYHGYTGEEWNKKRSSLLSKIPLFAFLFVLPRHPGHSIKTEAKKKKLSMAIDAINSSSIVIII